MFSILEGNVERKGLKFICWDWYFEGGNMLSRMKNLFGKTGKKESLSRKKGLILASPQSL